MLTKSYLCAMKLSIIIPVYRVEDTLDKCVESVLKQDYDDMDIILVDDGSPDDCPQKCDDWAKKDTRIRVIHKANGGLSDARNTALDIVHGDYITFVDSDDFISLSTYGPLMDTLSKRQDIDILEYPVFINYRSPKQRKLDFTEETVYDNISDYWYKGQAYLHSYACNKIYRASLFEEIRYPKGIVFEDIHTLPLLLKKAKTIMTTGKGLYYYSQNPSGITATADGNALRMLLQPHVEIIKDSNFLDRNFQTYYLHVLNIQMDVFEQAGDDPILPQIHLNPQYFNGKQQFKAVALNILGIKRLCITNKILHKIWRSR